MPRWPFTMASAFAESRPARQMVAVFNKRVDAGAVGYSLPDKIDVGLPPPQAASHRPPANPSYVASVFGAPPGPIGLFALTPNRSTVRCVQHCSRYHPRAFDQPKVFLRPMLSVLPAFRRVSVKRAAKCVEDLRPFGDRSTRGFAVQRYCGSLPLPL
jgi:hypothetical protein